MASVRQEPAQTHDAPLLLANEHLALAFDRTHGALLSLVDRASGSDFMRDPEAPHLLFRLSLRLADGRLAELDSDQAGRIDTEFRRTDAGEALVLRLTDFPDRALAVAVTVALPAGSPLSRWRLQVQGVGPGEALAALLCPLLSGVLKVGDPLPGEAVVTPVQSEGYLFTDPYPVVDGLPLRAGYPESPHVGLGEVHGLYPGAQSMQLMLYRHDRAGLYLACHDPDMHVKGFHLAPLPARGPYPTLWVSHHPPATGDADFAYDTVVGVFHGDWHAGADLYRAWARQQWWCARRLAERDIAPWVRQGFGVWQMSNYHIPQLKLNHSLDQIAGEVNELSRQAGVPLAALVFNFEQGGAWTGPVGLPPREGEAAFRAAMEKLRRAGNRGFVYIPGGNWYVAIDTYDPPFSSWEQYEEEGRAITLVDAQGQRPVHTWYAGWHVARLCPATAGNARILDDEVQSCLRWGVDWIQIDNFPCGGPEACYADDHGHPPGHGPWYTRAWQQTLADVRARAKAANPDCVLSVEGMSEVYIPYVDLYDNRAGNMEYFGHHNPHHPAGGQTIPLFEYVYGGYVAAYQAAYPECNRPEVRYWARCLGKSLAHGVVPSAGRYWPEPAHSNPVTLAFYLRVIRATRAAWDYITFGDMLPPPVIDVPDIQAAYVQFSGECLDHLLDKNRHVVTDRAVQHSAWSGPDGTLAYLFVNIADQPMEFDVVLGEGVVTTAPWHCCRTVDGERQEAGQRYLPVTERVRLAPLSVTMLELAATVRPAVVEATP